MRLLLRANSHNTAPDGSIEVAASPDTPRRERWEWQVRVSDAVPDAEPGRTTATVRISRPGGDSVLAVTADPVAVTPRAELLQLPTEVTRNEQDLVVLVVGAGVVQAEGRHLLHDLDALVLAGDDPLLVSVEQASEETATVALVRLEPSTAGSIAWVP